MARTIRAGRRAPTRHREPTAFEDAPVTLQAEVTATGYSGEPLVAQLVKLGHTPGLSSSNNPPSAATNAQCGQNLRQPPAWRRRRPADKVVSEQQKRAGSARSRGIPFQFKPDQAGLSFYRCKSRPRKDWIA